MKVDVKSKEADAKRLPWHHLKYRCILQNRSCIRKRVIIPDCWGV